MNCLNSRTPRVIISGYDMIYPGGGGVNRYIPYVSSRHKTQAIT
jgi:hypothetical protein